MIAARRNRAAINASLNRMLDEARKAAAKTGVDLKVIKNPPFKMSEVIIHYAQPLLDTASTDRQWRAAIGTAVAVWNLSLRPDVTDRERSKRVRAMGRDLSTRTRKDLEEIVVSLLERKKLLFPHIENTIMDYEIATLSKGHNLNVTYLGPRKDGRKPGGTVS